MKDGIHTIPAADYHADPAESPSLSASVAHILCTSSPKHAWTAHPRLNPDFRRVEEDKFSIGTIAHALILQGVEVVEVVNADNWRTDAAKEARDAARAVGRVPLLAKHYEQVVAMVAATTAQLDAVDADPPLFTDGQPEQTIIWQDGGVICRALVDWLRDDMAAIEDLKTSSRTANPERWSRGALFDQGADIQAAFYRRGIEALTGIRPEWRWALVETQPPYALSVVVPGADVLAVAEAKVNYALGLWRRCVERDEWPGYQRSPFVAELPAWADDAKWLVDTYRDAA